MNKKPLALFFCASIVFFSLIRSGAQSLLATTDDCQTEMQEVLYQQFLEEVPRIQEFTANVSASQQRQSQVVPVYFTILRNDDGSFAGREVDEALIDEALARLDSLFAPINLRFERFGDINYVDNTKLSKFNSHRHLMDLSYVSTALNIYTRSGTGSFAQFPGNVNPNYSNPSNAISSRNNLLSLSSSGYLDPTFAHEVGHSYGLVHTFEGARVYNNPDEPTPNYHGGFWDHPYGAYHGNAWRRELVLRSSDGDAVFTQPNAAFAGDFVEDTPAFCKLSKSYFPNWESADCQTYPFNGQGCNGCIVFNCNYEGDYVDYNGHELQNTEVSVRNIMAYTGSCRQEFTAGQYERMAYYNAVVRSQQYDNAIGATLRDEVAYEGTEIGIDDVLVMFGHEDTYRHCNAVTNTDGQFQGILYAPRASAKVLKVGSNPDPTFDDNPNDYLVPSTEVILENSYTSEDWLEGITIKDALLLHQYILGDFPLNGYKQIAADLDNDGKVTIEDSWLMLSLLVGDINNLPGQRSPWRFVPEYIPHLYAHTFHADPFNMTIGSLPYEQSAPYLEEGWFYEIPDGLSGRSGFDGIKLGDLDGSSVQDPTQSVLARTCPKGKVGLINADVPVAAGQTVELAISLSTAEELSAFQMGISLNNNLVELVAATPESLLGWPEEHSVGYSSKRSEGLSVAWLAEGVEPKVMEEGAALFRLVLKAKKALPNLQEALRLDDAILKTNFLDGEGCSLPLMLEVKVLPAEQAVEKTLQVPGERLSCYPNPAMENLLLSFRSEEAGKATIFIQDGLGRAVKKQLIVLHAGWNEARVGLRGLNAGVYTVGLKASGGVFAQKFFKKDEL